MALILLKFIKKSYKYIRNQRFTCHFDYLKTFISVTLYQRVKAATTLTKSHQIQQYLKILILAIYLILSGVISSFFARTGVENPRVPGSIPAPATTLFSFPNHLITL